MWLDDTIPYINFHVGLIKIPLYSVLSKNFVQYQLSQYWHPSTKLSNLLEVKTEIWKQINILNPAESDIIWISIRSRDCWSCLFGGNLNPSQLLSSGPGGGEKVPVSLVRWVTTDSVAQVRRSWSSSCNLLWLDQLRSCQQHFLLLIHSWYLSLQLNQ